MWKQKSRYIPWKLRKWLSYLCLKLQHDSFLYQLKTMLSTKGIYIILLKISIDPDITSQVKGEFKFPIQWTWYCETTNQLKISNLIVMFEWAGWPFWAYHRELSSWIWCFPLHCHPGRGSSSPAVCVKHQPSEIKLCEKLHKGDKVTVQFMPFPTLTWKLSNIKPGCV